MSNQMQDAYQKTLKQAEAYKQAAIKKGLMNQFRKPIQVAPVKEETAAASIELEESNLISDTSPTVIVQEENAQVSLEEITQKIDKNMVEDHSPTNEDNTPPKKLEQSKSNAEPIQRPALSKQFATSQTKNTPQQQQVHQPVSKVNQSNANVYKQNAFSTATPGELTLLLYNGCLKFIDKSKKAIEEKDFQAKNRYIIRAQDIIRELMVTLKIDTPIGNSMLQVYDFINLRLVDANIKNDLEALQEARELVTEFRDTWKQAIKLDRQARHTEE